MSFQPSVATNRRLVYSPDCNSSSKQNCGLPQSGTIQVIIYILFLFQKLSKENNAETPTVRQSHLIITYYVCRRCSAEYMHVFVITILFSCIHILI